jgi:hypothetical protein
LHLRPHLVTPLLYVHFSVEASRLVSHPLFWYLFAYLDQKTMMFADPIFLVDSATVHAHAIPRLRAGVWHFGFQASMGPKGRDMWVPYRVHSEELGDRVLQVLRDQPQESMVDLASERGLRGADVLWIGRHRGQTDPQ